MNHGNGIHQRLGNVFAETFHLETLSPDTDLLEAGILDSFQFVELLLQLEQQFGLRLEIEDIDLDDLRTLERIAALIARHGPTHDSDGSGVCKGRPHADGPPVNAK